MSHPPPESWFPLPKLRRRALIIKFRGTSEAFASDSKAVLCAREIYAKGLHKSYQGSHFAFLTTPGQHSEDKKDHEMNLEFITALGAIMGGDDHPVVKMLGKSCADHKAIIDRFGRYPYRNAALGRESTAEEQAWLDDYDALPGFAKSQMKKPH